MSGSGRASVSDLSGSELLSQLADREREGRPLRVAVVGAGDYGQTLIAQLGLSRGLRPAVVRDRDLERAKAAVVLARPGGQAAFCSDEAELTRAVDEGMPTIVTDSQLVAAAPVDVVVDSTGDVEAGCRLAWDSLGSGKHVVMVNAEADATGGWLLAERARRAGLVYTLADGDQPSLLCGLVDWARLLGFEIVTAGKWTKRYSQEQARERLGLIPAPTASDVTNLDGSKTQIELASAANAVGFTIDCEGMHGLSLALGEIPERLRPREDGGLLAQTGVVDYVDILRQPAHESHPGGVFVVVTSSSDRTMAALAAKRIPVSRDGRHALLFRPQHLVGAETIRSVVLAALSGQATASPRPTPTVEVVTVAKQDLPAGRILKGLGSDEVFGRAIPYAEAGSFVPLGMARGCRLVRSLQAGEKLRREDIEPPDPSWLWSFLGTAPEPPSSTAGVQE